MSAYRFLSARLRSGGGALLIAHMFVACSAPVPPKEVAPESLQQKDTPIGIVKPVGDPYDAPLADQSWKKYFPKTVSFQRSFKEEDIGAGAPVTTIDTEGKAWAENDALIIEAKITVNISADRPGDWSYVDKKVRSWVLADKIRLWFPWDGLGNIKLMSPKKWGQPTLTNTGDLFSCFVDDIPTTLWLNGHVSFVEQKQELVVDEFHEPMAPMQYFGATVKPAWKDGSTMKVWFTAYRGEPRINLRLEGKSGKDLGTIDMK